MSEVSLSVARTKDTEDFQIFPLMGFWSGFDVDLCRAVSAAIFSEPNRVEFVEYAGNFRMTPLRVGEVDLMSRNGYWNMQRDNNFDVAYAGVAFYDGQGIMVRDDAEVVSALELKDISVCVVANTLHHNALERFFFNNQINYEEVLVEDAADLAGAYMAGICDAVTTSASSCKKSKSMPLTPSQHRILPRAFEQGADGSGGAQRRYEVANNCSLGSVCDDQRRRTGREFS